MARFITHGTIIQEPTRDKLKSGMDVVNLTIEERYQTAFKEVVNVYNIGFIGKIANAIPQNTTLCGSVAIVQGTISSNEYNGKHYYNMSGDEFTLVKLGSSTREQVEKEEKPVVKNNSVQLPLSASEEETDVDDDDLPF